MKRSILVLSIILSVVVSNLAPVNVNAITDDPWNYACPADELPLLDTAKMSDEDFFGKWGNDGWEVTGKLNYDYTDQANPDLKPLKYVEEMVKEGDYASAKKELLAYYRSKDYEKLDLGARRTLQSDLALDWIFSFNDSPITTFEVTDTYSTISLDVTANVQNKVQDFMLFARDKSKSTAYFHTKENTNPPTLEVVVNGATRVYTPVADLYTVQGQRTTNFGSEEEMLVRDSGASTSEPLDGDNSRAYFRFSVYDNEDPSMMITTDDIITSATLKLYGRTNDPSGAKRLILFQPESKNIAETSTYNDIPINTISWNGIEGGTDWANYYNRGYNAHSELANVQTRLQFLAPMLAEYYATMDERYIKGVFGLIADFAYDRGDPGWLRQLEVAERGNQFYVIYPYLLESEYMNPDIHTTIMKMMYQEAEYLYQDANFRPDGNWGVWDTQGFLKVCAMFPEFLDVSKNDTWVPKIGERIDTLMTNTVLDDGAYVEASMGYALSVYSKYYEFMDLTEKIGITLSDDFYDKFTKLTMYFIDMSASNGQMQSFGDGGGGIILDQIDKTAELYMQSDDPEMVQYGKQFKYYASQGQEGEEIDHTSTYYPQGKVAIMRDSWDANGQFAFINGGHGGGHNHKDQLSFHLAAYGRPLIKDTGAPSYDPKNPNRDFIMFQSRSHNVVEIDERAPIDALSNPDLTTSSMDSNDFFDFFEGETRLNQIDSEHVFDTRRKVLNIKPLGFYIISDYIVPPDDDVHKYMQNWHMDPYTAVLKEDGTNRFASSFSSGANVLLVPGDAQSVTPEFRDGLGFDGWSGTQRNDRYPAYKIEKSGVVNFDTIVFPVKPGEQREVITSQIPMDVPSETATAVKIDLDYPQKGDMGYYYLSYEDTPSLRTFDKYQTDAQMAFVGTNYTGMETMASLQDGKVLNVVGADGNVQSWISSDKVISNLGIYIYGNTLEVSSAVPLDDLGSLAIRSNGQIEKVMFNGQEIRYAESGDNILVGGNSFSVPVTLNSVTNKKEGYTGTNGIEKTADNFKLTVQPFSKLTGSSNWNGVMWIFPETVGKQTQLAFGSENETILSDKVLKLEVNEKDVSSVSYVKDGVIETLKSVNYSSLEEAQEDLLYGEAAVTISDDSAVIWTKMLTDFTISYSTLKEPDKEDNNGSSSGGRPGGRPSSGSGSGTGGGTGGGGTIISPPETEPDKPAEPSDPIDFTDIENHWAKAEIEDLTRRGIISNDSAFRPDDEIKRNELVKLVVLALEVPLEKYQDDFQDVSGDSWDCDYIKTGAAMGVIAGYDGYFRPNDAITREELAKVLVLAYQYKNKDEIEKKESNFKDEAEISEWAQEYVNNAVSVGLVKGLDDGRFGPKQKATRAQAAVMISRLLEVLK